VLGDRIGDVELAVVLKHQDRHGSDRLGHRGDPEQGIRLHRLSRRNVGPSARLQVQDLVLGDDDGDSARDFASVHRSLNCLADLRQSIRLVRCSLRRPDRSPNANHQRRQENESPP